MRLLRFLGCCFVAAALSLLAWNAKAAGRALAALFTLVLLTGMSFAGPSASQAVRPEISPVVTLSNGTLDLAWPIDSVPVDMFSLALGEAPVAVVRIDGVDHPAYVADWRLRGPPRQAVLLYRAANSAPLPDGTVTRVTVGGRNYIDHSSVRLLLPDIPAPVPTLSEWGMILFGIVLAGGAAALVHRRRPAL